MRKIFIDMCQNKKLIKYVFDYYDYNFIIVQNQECVDMKYDETDEKNIIDFDNNLILKSSSESMLPTVNETVNVLGGFNNFFTTIFKNLMIAVIIIIFIILIYYVIRYFDNYNIFAYFDNSSLGNTAYNVRRDKSAQDSMRQDNIYPVNVYNINNIYMNTYDKS